MGHLVDNYQIAIEKNEILIEGQLGWAKQQQMTPAKLMILRVVMLTGGRFFLNLIRKILQKLLITGKETTEFRFQRRLRWENDRWRIEDTLSCPSWKNVVSVGMGGDQTSIYVVMSRTFQIGQLQPWLDLTSVVRRLEQGQPLHLERDL